MAQQRPREHVVFYPNVDITRLGEEEEPLHRDLDTNFRVVDSTDYSQNIENTIKSFKIILNSGIDTGNIEVRRNQDYQSVECGIELVAATLPYMYISTPGVYTYTREKGYIEVASYHRTTNWTKVALLSLEEGDTPTRIKPDPSLAVIFIEGSPTQFCLEFKPVTDQKFFYS